MYSIILYCKNNKDDRYVSRPYSENELSFFKKELKEEKFVFIWLGAGSQVGVAVENIQNVIFVPYIEPEPPAT